jgi:o-succinylbenzoate synthase
MNSEIRSMRVFSVPLRNRFRRVERRDGVVLEGAHGWGEFSPFPEYGADTTALWLAAAIEAATKPFPPAVRDTVEVNTTIPALDAATAYRLAKESGCRTAKVKVAEPGQDLAADVERVAAVRDALGPNANIRIDVNGAWDVITAQLAITRLTRAAGVLEYVEQPCQTLSELAELRRKVQVPLAADESIRAADDPLHIAGLNAVDVLGIKVQPLGGVWRALEIIDAAGLPAVVSSAVETSVGLAAGVALAAALPELPYACGLGTATLLAQDLTDMPFTPQDGFVTVRRVAPDPALLTQAEPAPEDAAVIIQRMQVAAGALEAGSSR